ncbi:hypothetical protein [Frankia sp. Cr1]|uniref:hypothetical protein n=1 Tax=Frankia sp. Cr1 TaxID=3073931 RepID=UPI002AD46832|nr:hypothetical protein [Frankia sp. Cr1]
MPATTIKVDSAVRDRLLRVARARGVTMGALLQSLSIDLQAQQEWAEIEVAYERFQREDPAGWVEYVVELAEWEKVPGDPGDAADEWPEFNT